MSDNITTYAALSIFLIKKCSVPQTADGTLTNYSYITSDTFSEKLHDKQGNAYE